MSIIDISIMYDKIENVILFKLEQTSKMAKIYSQREFDKLDINITVEQWILLKIIHEHKGISQKELAEKSLRDPASITRTLDLLQKKSLLDRIAIPNNRRQYSLELTLQGQQFVDNHMNLIIAQRKKSIEGLTDNEINSLNSILEKMQNNLS